MTDYILSDKTTIAITANVVSGRLEIKLSSADGSPALAEGDAIKDSVPNATGQITLTIQNLSADWEMMGFDVTRPNGQQTWAEWQTDSWVGKNGTVTKTLATTARSTSLEWGVKMRKKTDLTSFLSMDPFVYVARRGTGSW